MELFNPQIYSARRQKLIDSDLTGIAIFPSNPKVYSNYPDLTYPYRQDSSFLYYFGLSIPKAVGLIDLDSGEQMLFADDLTMDHIIWTGPKPTVAEQAAQIGADSSHALDKLAGFLQNRPLHFLPPYHIQTEHWLAKLCPETQPSDALTALVIDQRNVKSSEEIAEIEAALAVTRLIHDHIMINSSEGKSEQALVAEIQQIVASRGMRLAYAPILSKRGEILHNHDHNNHLKNGDLVLADIGAESPKGYASDITRTHPVSGAFSTFQKEIYQATLDALLLGESISKAGISYKEVHLQACKSIVSSMIQIGLMKGDAEEAVAAGAHALFFPHGLGHMIGLDTHDMEALGESLVGYSKEVKRSEQFGTAYLRLGRVLQTGYVITIEPGIYFIPALIQKWKSEQKHTDFLNFSEIEKHQDFGGIRIEDNYLVTDDKAVKLGESIARSVKEVEFLSSVS